ncbi:MAG: response regulator [Pyrinomonadaceae bacterium]
MLKVSTTTSRSRRVLIAEGDAPTRCQVAEIVEQEGCVPVVSCDGREAYRILERDADFCAAIFDMTLPHIQGIELIRYMKTEKRLMNIPAMLMLSEESPKLPLDCFAVGALIFLPKPFTPAQLRNMLRLIVRRAA